MSEPIFLQTKQEFLDKIKTEDVFELVEDFSIGRFELIVRTNDGSETYVSPNVYAMSSGEDMSFVDDVERAILWKGTMIRRSQK